MVIHFGVCAFHVYLEGNAVFVYSEEVEDGDQLIVTLGDVCEFLEGSLDFFNLDT